jgi:ATP-dependent DNA helicase RecQ
MAPNTPSKRSTIRYAMKGWDELDTVVRIPTVEVSDGIGPNLAEVVDLASALPPINHSGSAYVAAMHAASALVYLVQSGLLPSGSNSWRISCEGRFAIALQAGLLEAQQLLEAIGELYGTQVVAREIRFVDDRPDVVLTWDDCEPWWSPGPASFGARLVRLCPVWLPVKPPLPAPPATWVPPVAGFSDGSLVVALQWAFPHLSKGDRDASFKHGQLEAIRRCLLGQDSLVLLPTGAGKSLIYQLSALLLPGLTIVVSPLVSLIEDQIDNLRRAGIDRAVGLSGAARERGEMALLMAELAAGVHFLCYVAPERLLMRGFRSALAQLAVQMPVPLVVIDEAHVVSEWGHGFRPSYLVVAQTGRRIGRRAIGQSPAIVGLTGTASRAVLRDLQRSLAIHDLDAVIVPGSFDRPELSFEVIRAPSRQKEEALRGVFRFLPQRLGLQPGAFLSPRGDSTSSGIIFCPHASADSPLGIYKVADAVRKATGADTRIYAGSKIAPEERDRSAKGFKNNEFPILAATKAFGMGIDKPNVRYTVHYSLPSSLEAFYQEAGRAGRDQQRAHCVVIASVDDVERGSKFLDPSVPASALWDMQNEVPWGGGDDIVQAMWFHAKDFRGSDADLGPVAELLHEIGELDKARTLDVSYGNDGLTLLQRAIHRLTLLGVVQDCEMHDSRPIMTIAIRSTSEETVRKALHAYVGSYSEARAQRILEELAPTAGLSTTELVLSYARTLVGFVYDTVEASRRAAIRAAWNWSCANTGEDLRRILLDYLQETEFKHAVDTILREAELDFDRWSSLLEEVSSPRDVQELAGAVDRSVVDFPDQPALLAMRAVIACYGAATADDVLSSARAAITAWRDKYAANDASAEVIARFILGNAVRKASPELQLRIVGALVDICGDSLAAWFVDAHPDSPGARAAVPALLQRLIRATDELLVQHQEGNHDRHAA